MEFGHLSPAALDKLVFSLPDDPPENQAILQAATKGVQRVYVGCAKWGRKEWVGKIYPRGTKDRDFLEEYGRHYNSIELNATNYQLMRPSDIQAWNARIHRDDFVFCPKAHRAISFMGPSDNKGHFTELFLSGIEQFGSRLGPVFMTINSKYQRQQENYFFDYLFLLRQQTQLFVEQRDPDLYRDADVLNRYYATLRDIRVGAVITDTAGRPDVLHTNLMVPRAFIRFVGNSLHPSDFPRIDLWVQRIKCWLEQGIEAVYFFLHMHDEGLSPELSRYTVEQLNLHCKLNLPEVHFVQ